MGFEPGGDAGRTMHQALEERRRFLRAELARTEDLLRDSPARPDAES